MSYQDLKIDSTSSLFKESSKNMAIQSQLNYNRFGDGSEFSLINNNGGVGIDQSYINNNIQSQALFHYPQHQQYSSQSFLDTYMEKQKREIDLFVKLQNERLRYVLQEQRKQEMDMILRKLEGRALCLMTQKEEEITKALSKKMELEDLLRKMEMENQTWQRMAQENEVMVSKLNSTLAEVKERAAATCHAVVEDEGSFCNFPVKKKVMSCCCLNCGSSGVTRVLFLPCRHLCCCVECEDGLVHCPVCKSPKKSRIEAFDF